MTTFSSSTDRRPAGQRTVPGFYRCPPPTPDPWRLSIGRSHHPEMVRDRLAPGCDASTRQRLVPRREAAMTSVSEQQTARVNVDDDAWRRFRILAIESSRSIADYLCQLVGDELRRSRKWKRRAEDDAESASEDTHQRGDDESRVEGFDGVSCPGLAGGADGGGPLDPGHDRRRSACRGWSRPGGRACSLATAR